MRAKRLWLACGFFGLLLGSAPARAQTAGPATPAAKAEAPSAAASEPADPALEEARRSYREGVERVQQARWGEALAAFERSETSRKHATTTFNIGACERALGHYTRAR
ncbi:MAG TPA: hypothetical protein VNG33_22550, partial [Polyangiaceae bacterium]|nr:hypothetical protein [Polyangiaceae bacterium]